MIALKVIVGLIASFGIAFAFTHFSSSGAASGVTLMGR